MDTTHRLPPPLDKPVYKFTGKRRPKEWRECACGCGERFKHSVGDGKLTKNNTHRKRLSRIRAKAQKE